MDYDYREYTPVDNTVEMRDPFRSGYKNVRFSVMLGSTLVVTSHLMANLPGIAHQIYGDVSLWVALLR